VPRIGPARAASPAMRLRHQPPLLPRHEAAAAPRHPPPRP
jgi:hypothetical protein